MTAFVQNFWELFLLSAPWLLLGLLVAAVMKAWIPMDWLQRQLGGAGARPVIKGALFGAPLPLCSCGVIPAAMQLRRGGASRGATVSFISATPETGVDSVSVSYALLGPLMAIVRPLAAITSAITAGLLVGKATENERAITASTQQSCCGNEAKKEPEPPPPSGCCSSNSGQAAAPHRPRLWAQARDALSYSTGKLLGDFYLWLLIGLFFAALVQTLVPVNTMAEYGGSIWAMLFMVLLSVPMYVCATASTPIAAALLMAGISPGAALVFMQAGPATNIATVSVVYKELGRRALAAYLFGVIVMSVFFGWLLDRAIAYFDLSVVSAMTHDHSIVPEWLELLAAFVLIGLILRILVRQWQQRSPEPSLQ